MDNISNINLLNNLLKIYNLAKISNSNLSLVIDNALKEFFSTC